MKHKKVLGLILSLVLVLCVAIPGTLASENLNQPALICEKTEHVHGGGCWTVPETPACGMEAGAGAHAHDGNCYGVLRGLTCTLPEDGNHTHGAECYGELKTLVCTVTEDENHTHGGECYAPKTGLVCSLAESAGHIHGESCYPPVLSCTLEEHTHDAGCYAAPLAGVENPEPTCTCGSADGTHVAGCPLYVAPQEPTCTCGSADGTHVAGCPLYVAPTCTCGSVDGTHVEGCPLYVAPTCTCIANEDGTLTYTEGCPVHEAPAAESEHIEGCSEECTGEECTCLCHTFQCLMETQDYEAFMAILNAISNEDYAKFTKKQVEQIEQKLQELKPTCTCIANEDGTLTYTEGCPVHEAPAAESEHIEGCSDECTDVECTCACHEWPLVDKMLACETMDELFALMDEATDEELDALTQEDFDRINIKIKELKHTYTPDPSIVGSGEIIYPTVNYTNVAPFGDPVMG